MDSKLAQNHFHISYKEFITQSLIYDSYGDRKKL